MYKYRGIQVFRCIRRKVFKCLGYNYPDSFYSVSEGKNNFVEKKGFYRFNIYSEGNLYDKIVVLLHYTNVNTFRFYCLIWFSVRLILVCLILFIWSPLQIKILICGGQSVNIISIVSLEIKWVNKVPSIFLFFTPRVKMSEIRPVKMTFLK